MVLLSLLMLKAQVRLPPEAICFCVTIWLFGALIINNCCKDFTLVIFYIIIGCDTVYGIFSVFFGSFAIFTNYNEEKCWDVRAVFFNFLLFNIIYGLGVLMRSCIAILIYILIKSMRWYEWWKDNRWWRDFVTVFKRCEYQYIENPLFHQCTICCEDFNRQSKVIIVDCDIGHIFHDQCIW